MGLTHANVAGHLSLCGARTCPVFIDCSLDRVMSTPIVFSAYELNTFFPNIGRDSYSYAVYWKLRP